MKRFIFVILFIMGWILADAGFNNALRTSIFGRYAHWIEWTHYGVFALLGMVAAKRRSHRLFAFFLVWCALDEGIQTFLPNRVASLLDVVRNVAGFLGGYLIVDVFQMWRAERVGKNGETEGNKDRADPT